SVLNYYINDLKTKGVQTKHMIIYCRKMEDTSKLWKWMTDSLAVLPGDPKLAKNRLVERYHSLTDDETAEQIYKHFNHQSGKIRCLISTIAFGMGISIPIDIVSHWGFTPTVLDYIQESGRCARIPNTQGTAIIYDVPVHGIPLDKDIRSNLVIPLWHNEMGHFNIFC
ncbi:unnamed protein product, partial [Owenia fusiformis]